MADDLYSRLAALASSHALPMHMPGHKRNAAMAEYLGALGAKYDITEIDGFDDLHAAKDILAEGMRLTARLWGARRSFWMVNGSTGGILAGILGACPRGARVIVARNCHISVYHAIEIGGLIAEYVMPAFDSSFGISASVSPGDIARAIDCAPDARLVIVTSPTYEGVISDIRGICAAAHARGVPVLVDEAHGAHLGLTDDFPAGAVACGADIVAHSLHKTLPSLTQTAVLHVNGNLADADAIARQIDILETSSPSYLLLASIDGCVRLLSRERARVLGAWRRVLDNFYARARGLSHLRVPAANGVAHPDAFALDPGKITVSCAGTGLTGAELADRLRREFDVEVEMAARDIVIAMTGAGDTDATLARFADALLLIDGRLTGRGASGARAPGLPKPRYRADVARALKAEDCAISRAEGRVCAEYIFAYPPGIPLYVPGEIFDRAGLEEMNGMRAEGVRLRAGERALARNVRVLKMKEKEDTV